MPALQSFAHTPPSWRAPRIIAVSFACLLPLLLIQARARGADAPEVLHQRLLAGEELAFNPSDPELTRSVEAKWIREAALKNVPIRIYNGIIIGPLDLANVTFERPVQIARCVFVNNADFTNAVFRQDTEFSQVIGRGGISFLGATFERKVSFVDSRFEDGGVEFADTHFLGEFNATSAVFGSKKSSTSNFSRARFDAAAYFPRAKFGANGVNFNDVKFGGDATFIWSTFEGNARFDRTHFVALATFGVSDTSGATFLRDAVFAETHFDGDASFGAVAFNSTCSFYKSRFESNAVFMGARFRGPVSFDSAHVLGDLIFESNVEQRLSGATFGAAAQFTFIEVDHSGRFSDTVFSDIAVFDGARFLGPASFHSVKFKATVRFLDTSFGSEVSFPGAIFESDTFFDRAQIAGATLFSRKPGDVPENLLQSARFEGATSFSGTHFGSESRFIGVTFARTSDFSAAQFDGDAHFEKSSFLGLARFQSTVFRVVYFSSPGQLSPFSGDIDLLGCTYDRIQVDWRSLLRYPNGTSRIHPYDRQPYIELETVLKKAGFEDDADEVYAERRRVERSTLTGMARLWDELYRWIANYGIDLWGEFTIAVLSILIGTIVFSRRGAVEDDEGNETKITLHQAFPLAFHLFLPFSLPAPPPWKPSRHVLHHFLIFRTATSFANFLQILGWILIPLAAAMLAGILRRGG